MLMTIDTSDLINSLPTTISSMKTAFITSVLGIISSMCINYFIEVKSCEHMFTTLLLRLENIITSEVTSEKSKKIDSRVEKIKDTISQISNSIKSIERFDQISKDLNEFNNEFINTVQILRDLLHSSQGSIDVFDKDIKNLDKQFSILNMKFKHLFDKYDNVEITNNAILNNIKISSENIKQSTDNQLKIKNYIRDSIAHLGVYERNTQDLLNSVFTNERNRSVDINNLNQNIQKLDSTIDVSSEELSKKLEMIFEIMDIYKDVLNREKSLLNDMLHQYSEKSTKSQHNEIEKDILSKVIVGEVYDE